MTCEVGCQQRRDSLGPLQPFCRITGWLEGGAPVRFHSPPSVFTRGSWVFPIILVKRAFAARYPAQASHSERGGIFKGHEKQDVTEALSSFQGPPGAFWPFHSLQTTSAWKKQSSQSAPLHNQPRELPAPSSGLLCPFLTGVSQTWDLKAWGEPLPGLPR